MKPSKDWFVWLMSFNALICFAGGLLHLASEHGSVLLGVILLALGGQAFGLAAARAAAREGQR